MVSQAGAPLRLSELNSRQTTQVNESKSPPQLTKEHRWVRWKGPEGPWSEWHARGNKIFRHYFTLCHLPIGKELQRSQLVEDLPEEEQGSSEWIVKPPRGSKACAECRKLEKERLAAANRKKKPVSRQVDEAVRTMKALDRISRDLERMAKALGSWFRP